MPVKWIAPTAALVGVFVGGFWSWFVARGGRKQAEKINADNIAHAERMADKALRQQRIENAYIELLSLTEAAGNWAARVQPLIVPAPPVPDFPPEREQERTRALVRAHGSEDLKRLFNEYSEIIHKMRGADFVIRQAPVQQEIAIERERGKWDEIIQQERKLLDLELRPAEQAKRQELADKVAEELRGASPPVRSTDD